MVQHTGLLTTAKLCNQGETHKPLFAATEITFKTDIPATGNCMHGWLKFTCNRKPSSFHWRSSIEFHQRLQLHVLLGMVWHLPCILGRAGAPNSCCQLPLTTASSACCGQDAAALHSSPSPINGGNSPTLCLHNHITSLSKWMHGHDQQIWQARHVVQPLRAKQLVLGGKADCIEYTVVTPALDASQPGSHPDN